MDIAISVLGHSFTVSVGLENVVAFAAGAVLMFIFDRWVLGRKVRTNLKAAEKKIVAQEARLSVLERMSGREKDHEAPVGGTPVADSEENAGAEEGNSRRAEELWRTSPGAGHLAAKVLLQASTLEEVRDTYSAFRAAHRREDSALANWAFLYRLEEAGHGNEVYGWAFDLTGEEEEIMVDDDTQVELMRWRDRARGQGTQAQDH